MQHQGAESDFDSSNSPTLWLEQSLLDMKNIIYFKLKKPSKKIEATFLGPYTNDYIRFAKY